MKEKFKCNICNLIFAWVLSFKNSGTCVYCKGKYEDGTICKGGRGVQ